MDEHLPLRARWLIVPLVLSMVLIALFIYLYKQRKTAKYPVGLGTVAWLVPVVGMNIATAVAIYLDLFTCDRLAILFFVVTVFSVGLMILMRDFVHGSFVAFLQKRAAEIAATTNSSASAGEKPDEAAGDASKKTSKVTQATAHATRPSLLARLRAKLKTPCALQKLATTGLFLLISFLLFMSLEFAQYSKILESMDPLFFISNLALILLFITTLYFLAQRRGGLIALLALVFFDFGIGCYYLLRFKYTVIIPSDFFALGTAASVANNFNYYLTPDALWAACYFMLVCGFCSWLRPMPNLALKQTVDQVKHGAHFVSTARTCPTKRCPLKAAFAKLRAHLQSAPTAAKNMGAFLIGAFLIYVVCFVLNYRDFGAINNYWSPWETYRVQGTLVSFISEWQDLKLPVPKDYSDEKAEELIKHYANKYDTTLGATPQRAQAAEQFNQLKPAVVAIMNETYSDLSIYDGMHVGYKGPEYIKNGLSDALLSGTLSMSILGGGTANSEFEYLTNQSCLFTGPGIAYSIYNLKNSPSLAREFKKLGYQTTAMHPFGAQNWNRNNAYPDLGFDKFISDTDFDRDAPRWRGWISDQASYQKVLDVLEKSDKPQFILDVTVTNHSGYDDKRVGDDYRPGYQPDFGGEKITNELNEYLGSIKRTEEEFQWFIEKVKQLKRPVVVVFFGDHQPSFPTYYNDAWFKDEDEATHLARLYQTTYIIWANYKVSGAAQNNPKLHASASNLSSYTLHTIGAPLTDYQKAQLAINQELPIVTSFTVMDKDGTWYLPTDKNAPTASLQNDLAKMSYYNFARKL